MPQIPDLELKLLLREVKTRLIAGGDALTVLIMYTEEKEKKAVYGRLLQGNEDTLSKLEYYLKHINA